MAYATHAYVQPGVAVAHPGHPQLQFQSAAQARQYQQQQQMMHQQQQQQHQQQQMQVQYQQQQQQPSHQVVQGNVVMVNGYARPANPSVQRGQPGQEYAVPFTTAQYVEHQPVAGPSNPAGQAQQMATMHGHQMAVPPGMTLQTTSQGRMIVVPLAVPQPAYSEGAPMSGYRPSVQTSLPPTRPGLQTRPSQTLLHTPVQPGYAPTPRSQATPGLIPGTVVRPPASAGDVLGSALSQGPLEHPTTGVGGNDPNGHPDGIVMIDSQAYSARAVRERQQIQRHNMIVQQQQEHQQQQHDLEMRARQQELADAEDQAEEEMQMQLHLQRQAQATAHAQAQAQAQARVRLQQQQLIQDRERERTMQAQQQQQRQKQQQMQLELRQQEQQQQQAQQRQQIQMQAASGAYVVHQSPAGPAQAQAGQIQTLRTPAVIQGSPSAPVPVQSEAQIQQMREIQAQQIREIQIRQLSTPSEQPGQARAGQISTAEAMAMRDREREMRNGTQGPTDTPVQMRLASSQRMPPGSAMSTPAGPGRGPGSEMASTALSNHSQANSQAGTAVRLAQMQLQAGLGLGMPVKRETGIITSPAGYPPPRAISMAVQTEEMDSGSTRPNFVTDSQDFTVQAARLVSQSPTVQARQTTVGPHGPRESSQVPVSIRLNRS